MAHDYDLFVIGAGSGGVRAARIAASYGAKVAVAEEFRVGGTCVIRGCVPKKLMVYASRYADDFADSVGFGWSAGEPSFDWSKLMEAKDTEVDRLEGAYGANLERSNVEIIRSRAVVAGPNAVTLVGENRTVTAGTILIATGGTPFMDRSVPGAEFAISSNEIFDLPEMPKRVLVIGGGYIAVEFAGIFNGLGAETTLLYRGEEILRGFDRDVRHHLHREMVKRGVEIVTEDRLQRIEKVGDGFVAHTHHGLEIEVDQILMAIGRVANTAGLGLEAAGVKLGGRGEVIVDPMNRTSVPSIYAVGDVTDRVNLTPVAIREGHAFADSVFGNKPTVVDHALIPTAVFATPEIGTVGATEDEVIARCRAYDVYKTTFRPMRNTISGRDERTLMKILVDAEDDLVLGVHIVGPDAAEMVQLLAVAMRMGAKKHDLDMTMALHPSAAEELVTMRTPSERHPAPKAPVPAE